MNVQDTQLYAGVKADIQVELANPKFDSVRHGGGYAYDKGCAGPLCRKYVRDKQRIIARAKMEPGGILKPRMSTQLQDQCIELVIEELQCQDRLISEESESLSEVV